MSGECGLLKSSRRKQSYCYYNFVTINVSYTLLVVKLFLLSHFIYPQIKHSLCNTHKVKQIKSENIYIYKNVYIYSKERQNGNPKWS